MKESLFLIQHRILQTTLKHLVFVAIIASFLNGSISWGQTYFEMSSGNYSQNFADIANWMNNYASGIGANNWKVATTATGSTVNNATVFATGTAGGVQKGTQSIIILATGTNSGATDLLLNFSGRTAGTISLDWSKVTNTTNDASPRSSDFKLQYSTDGGSNFTDITGYTIPRILNNSTAESGSLSSITLPAALNNQSTVVLRFFVWNNGQTGGSDNRPKWQLDNISVTSTAAAATTTITTGAITGTPFTLANCSSTASGSIAYTISGTFNSGNIFRAELSDATGSFTQPVAIGSVSSTAAGSISITIPANTPSGTGYRIRVVGSDPSTIGSNSTAFTITQNGEYCASPGDYRSRVTGNWTTANTWDVYSYNSSTLSYEWVIASVSPNNALINVTVRNHTVTYNVSLLTSINHLIVESGGKLFRNLSDCNSLRYINLGGDILCNGTIGNGSTADVIGLNIQSNNLNHTIKGSGTCDLYRIRLSDETNDGATRGNANLTIDMDVTLRWRAGTDCAGAGGNAIYSNRSGTAVFNVTVNAGKTLTITQSNASFGMDGANSAPDVYPGTNRGGGYTVFGTIVCAGQYMLGSNNAEAQRPYLTIKNGGVVRTAFMDYGDNNVLSGGVLTIENGGRLEITSTDASSNTWVGSGVGSIVYTINNGSTVHYSGNVNQNVPGNLFNYRNFRKSGTGNAILTSTANVFENISFEGGDINTTSTNLLVMQAGSSHSTCSNSSHVNGPVRKIGNTAFTFPVGNGTYFREARISAPGNVADHFTCQYFLVDPDVPYTRSIKDPTLDHISACEYWQLDRTNGTSNVSVTLSWNSNTSCGVTLLSDLKVARWNGSMWKDHGNGATTGNTTAGTVVTSAAVTSFSPFTLASVSAENPLPVELLSFEAKCNENQINFEWATASERNAYYFDIEGSNDGVNWEIIFMENCAGNTSWRTDYQHIFPNSELFDYFRLSQYDFDGTKTSFEAILNTCKNQNTEMLTIYPNPTSDILTVSSISSIQSYRIISYDGKIVAEKSAGITQLISVSDFTNGIYYIEFQLKDNRIERIPFVKK